MRILKKIHHFHAFVPTGHFTACLTASHDIKNGSVTVFHILFFISLQWDWKNIGKAISRHLISVSYKVAKPRIGWRIINLQRPVVSFQIIFYCVNWKLDTHGNSFLVITSCNKCSLCYGTTYFKQKDYHNILVINYIW